MQQILACPHLSSCGGCQVPSGVEYQAYLQSKSSRLHALQSSLGKAPLIMQPQHKEGYRRKVEWRGRLAAGQMHLGYFKDMSREFLAIRACPVLHPLLQQVLNYLTSCPVPNTAEIKFRLVAQLYQQSSAVALVVISEQDMQPFIPIFAQAPGVSYCKLRAETGDDLLPVEDGVWVRPGGFMQSHVEADPILRHAVAREFADAKTLIELFCGNGHLTQSLPAEVQGYDIDVLAAQKAADSRHLYWRRDLYLHDDLDWNFADQLLADPGRLGLKNLVIKINAAQHITRFLYISCNPDSLLSDWQQLQQGGWQCRQWQAVDLFPWTSHWEVLLFLERSSSWVRKNG